MPHSTSFTLIRHGHAAAGLEDKTRPLNAQGVQEAKNCGVILSKAPPFDLIITSSATRAKETASEILTQFNYKPRIIEIDEIFLPYAPAAFHAIDEAVKTYHPKNVLIVGHMNIINSIGLLIAPTATELLNVNFNCCEGFEITATGVIRYIKADKRT